MTNNSRIIKFCYIPFKMRRLLITPTISIRSPSFYCQIRHFYAHIVSTQISVGSWNTDRVLFIRISKLLQNFLIGNAVLIHNIYRDRIVPRENVNRPRIPSDVRQTLYVLKNNCTHNFHAYFQSRTLSCGLQLLNTTCSDLSTRTRDSRHTCACMARSLRTKFERYPRSRTENQIYYFIQG